MPDARPTRDVILDVAERHFAERGYAGASVREIATDAGLKNQASLYHHFEHKRALYEAVLTRGLAPIIDAVTASGRREHLLSSQSTESLLQFLDSVIDYLAGNPYLPRLIQRAALDDTSYLSADLARVMRPLYDEGIAVVAQSTAGWEPADNFHVAVAMFQVIFGYFANAKLFEIVAEHDPLSPEAIERQRRFLRRAVAELLGYSDKGRPAGQR